MSSGDSAEVIRKNKKMKWSTSDISRLMYDLVDRPLDDYPANANSNFIGLCKWWVKALEAGTVKLDKGGMELSEGVQAAKCPLLARGLRELAIRGPKYERFMNDWERRRRKAQVWGATPGELYLLNAALTTERSIDGYRCDPEKPHSVDTLASLLERPRKWVWDRLQWLAVPLGSEVVNHYLLNERKEKHGVPKFHTSR